MNDSTADTHRDAPLIRNEYWITHNTEHPSRTQQMQQYPGDTRVSFIRPLHQDDTVLIEYRQLGEAPNALIFTTTDQHDHIRVLAIDGALAIEINTSRYHLPDLEAGQILLLRTLGGNDAIQIGATVSQSVIVESGHGDDTILTGRGRAWVYAGRGNDRIFTRDGSCYIEAGEGNDDVIALGVGDLIVYGGKGQDRIDGGAANSFIDGGKGNDKIIGGEGHNILSGGDGDDQLTAGPGSNTLYTGTGADILEALKPADVVFTHQTTDTGGLIVEGTLDFKERVDADLKLLQGSAVGQKLLHALGQATRQVGAAVFIKELSNTNNAMFVENGVAPGQSSFIQNGAAGTGAQGGTVFYNPSFTGGKTIGIVHFYHELCHAYNLLTGTVFQGESADGINAGRPRPYVANAELQAVGLPVEGLSFDFDEDPHTPALNSNPQPFTENGLRHEFGLPLRKQYNNH